MSQKIDPREVLIYLNELGYTNINAQQLKEFITDLTKLIKHEHKTKYRDKENVRPTQCSDGPYCEEFYCPNSRPNERKQTDSNIFSSHYSHGTMSSKAKDVQRVAPKQISVHIIRPRDRSPKHDHCRHVEKEVTDKESELKFVQNVEPTDGSKVEVETESTIIGIRPDSKQTVTSHTSRSKTTHPKSSFIRTGVSKPVNKCDPVALYHFYQTRMEKTEISWSRTTFRFEMGCARKVDGRT
ncbi:hypothetical protein NQ317_007063 [Molorchus minor]|uniref:Centriolar and ciliogenesis-associated protein HYLS1 C-terminal domain-containing protein n=1 Tax=Molorchus minor TaxID=1323400 RepID=A0ABQ9K3U7_9CUCU|nr:hypothetical protein NQ317_007063 [Molorchus minor]